MLKIEIIENDIRESLKHLEFMNITIRAFESLKIIFGKSKPEIVEGYDFGIQNFQALMTVVGLEIALILKGIHYSKSDLERTFLIKKGILILYETKILLDKLSITIKNINLELPELENDINSLIKILKQTKKRIISESRIEDIRNNISAHINPNFLEYYGFIEKIDFKKDLELLLQTTLILRQIHGFLLRIEMQKLIK